MKTTNDNSYADAKRVTLVSVFINIILVVFKTIAGYLGNSSAMVADGIHSLSDFATDIVVIVGAKYSTMPEDETHPYGHGKIETFASLAIAIALFSVGAGILYNAIINTIHGKELQIPKMITLIAALISIISKELLFRYTISVGKKHNMNSIIANAWHHRSDAYSSIAAMGGIIGAMMGFKILDPIAAGLVAFLICKVGVDIGKESFMDLIDTAADKKICDCIEQIIKDTKEVENHHDLKTRKVGNKVIADLHIEINPSISVVDGHNIAEKLKAKIIESIKEVGDILIHIEPLGDRDGVIYEVDKDKLHKRVVKKCGKLPGVLGVHSIKIHHFGCDIVINIDVEVNSSASVADGHNIARTVKSTIFELSENIKDVVVHIDPYEENS